MAGAAGAGRAWTVRAGGGDVFEPFVLGQGVVGIDWSRVGDLGGVRTHKAMKDLVAATYPEVELLTRASYALQLHAFRSSIRAGDPVVLLRETSPEVALGIVTGGYQHRADAEPGTPAHVRTVQWRFPRLRRGELGSALLHTPGLSAVSEIKVAGAVDRLREYAERTPSAEPDTPTVVEAAEPAVSLVEKLQRNLDYARDLTQAGSHFERLQLGAFEIADIYRAAWTQAVAALDHWVHEEIAERLLHLAERPDIARPRHYPDIQLPLEAIEQIRRGDLSARSAVDAYYVQKDLSRATYQDPDRIREGLRMVADVNDLWQRVAVLLDERAGNGRSAQGKDVIDHMREIVRRRNKIVHEYDQDPASATGKRAIDGATTSLTINWIGQVVEAIVLALDQR